MCKQGTRPVLDRVQPTAIGSPPNSFRLREMASVPDSASVPSAERERGIEKTDELRRLNIARNRKMLWGGRRGKVATSSLHLTDGVAAMPQPNDLSRSLVALDQNSTIIAVVEL